MRLHRDGARGVVDADNEVLSGIRLVASLLATRRLVVHRSCRGLIQEFPGYTVRPAWAGNDDRSDRGDRLASLRG